MPSAAGAARRAGTTLLGIGALLLACALVVGIVVAGVLAARHLLAFGVAGGASLFLLLVGTLFRQRGRRLPRRFVLELDCSVLPSEAAASPLARLRGRATELPLAETVDVLARAAADQRVAGVLVRAGVERAGMAQVQELRAALRAVAATGKFTIAVADTFGELHGANAGYYLATACGEIVLQPGGMVGLVGLAREANFVVGALGRLGIEPIFEGRYEYKSAANRLIHDRLTDAEREQEQRLVDSHLDQIVRGIAEGRRQSAGEIRALVDRGPFLATEALRLGLVDALGHSDEVDARVKARAETAADLVSLGTYARASRRRASGRGKAASVALITASGSIVRRATSPLPSPGGPPLDAGALAKVIREAAESSRVRAILLRIDSPGGSAVASETIHRALVRAREAGTPVVVSMGNVAASGGYYVACGADRIVAQPGTVTGSIGVFAGKLVIKQAKGRIGVTTDEVHAGEHALITTANRGFTPSEHERFSASLDAIYETFVGRVAEGRKMSTAAVDAVARGRVWTGEDALAAGLVDTLGGFPEALAEVRSLLGLEPDGRIRIGRHPRPHGLRGRLRTVLSPRAGLAGMLATGVRAMRADDRVLRLPDGEADSVV